MIASYLKKHKPRAKILALDAKEAFSKQSLFTDAWNELYPGMIEWVPSNRDGRVVRVDTREKVLETEFGTKHKVDVANVIPPQSAARIRDRCRPDERKRLGAGQSAHLRGDARQHIHVIGDANIGQPMPKSGYIANSTSKQAVASAVALLQGREPPASPVYFNTCYSHVGDEYGILGRQASSVQATTVSRRRRNSAASPRAGRWRSRREQRRLEALYAGRLVRLDREGTPLAGIGAGGLLRCGFSCAAGRPAGCPRSIGLSGRRGPKQKTARHRAAADAIERSDGAARGIRNPDPLITYEVLYQHELLRRMRALLAFLVA